MAAPRPVPVKVGQPDCHGRRFVPIAASESET